MNTKGILLNGEWKLVWRDNKQVCTEQLAITTYAELIGQERVIDAVVPGNLELDLYRNGVIEDPFFGNNVLSLERFESVHMWYGRQFDYTGAISDIYLDFEGIDTLAEVYLNGVLIGKPENMLIAHLLKAEGLREGTNDLVVHILPSAIEARKYPPTPGDNAFKYNYEGLRVRKAIHAYGWDIMPRIVSAGIWRDVSLVEKKPDSIEDTYLYTIGTGGDGKDSTAILYYHLKLGEDEIARYSISVEGECGDSRFFSKDRLWFTSGKLGVHIPNSKLWWTAGRGAQNLYQVKVTLLFDGQPVDEKEFRFGIRTVELVRTSVTDTEGNGDFHIKLNGERLFVKGTNWVPADAFHSRDKERIPEMLALVKEIGCNVIRCWGGNVYEDHDFFDLCDEYGFLVWQDFSFACALYPQDDAFCGKVAEEIRSVVQKLRRHPSLGIWAGDNECDVAYMAGWSGLRRDPNQNRITRQIIPDILKMEDPVRPFLPSSPYVDEVAYEKGIAYLPEDHLWGPRDYHKSMYYMTALAHFASEMGYHGCPSPESIKQFISPDCCWPAQNDEWIIHGTSPEADMNGQFTYRRELMFNQVKGFFGEIPDTLEDFALASQIVQAEAMKFFIELFRSMKWRRTGIIWWNIIDGWPQFSDAVVDYYFNKKLAYHYIKTAQQPLCLMFAEPQDGQLQLLASNDTREAIDFTYRVTDLASGRMVCDSSSSIAPDGKQPLAALPYQQAEQGIYLIEWQAGEYSGKNHYLYGNPSFSLAEYRALAEKADLLHADGFEIVKE